MLNIKRKSGRNAGAAVAEKEKEEKKGQDKKKDKPIKDEKEDPFVKDKLWNIWVIFILNSLKKNKLYIFI